MGMILCGSCMSMLVARIWLLLNVLDIVAVTFKAERRIPSIHFCGSPT